MELHVFIKSIKRYDKNISWTWIKEDEEESKIILKGKIIWIFFVFLKKKLTKKAEATYNHIIEISVHWKWKING
jgi:hypothetical protein